VGTVKEAAAAVRDPGSERPAGCGSGIAGRRAKLKGLGKEAEILVFPDEGHDVLKFANRVTCYNAIAGFFEKHLGVQPRSE
jgi:hypothetical protein